MSQVRVGDGDDDTFVRRMTLGANCFCGAICSPLQPMKCLAHGYCEAHSTPVKDQITAVDRQRLAVRIGIPPSLVAQLWGGV